MNYITDVLYWISTGLLVPVIVLLLFLFIRSLIMIGTFFGQYLSIRKTEVFLRTKLEGITVSSIDKLHEELSPENPSLVVRTIYKLLELRGESAQIQHLLSNFEIVADKDLALSKTLTKMGPMLGLMGTLIPMGPALVGLSTGDIASMAYNMQVAFATTVVGLFISAVGFITQQVKQRWYLQDMVNLELLAALLQTKSTAV